jgi:hypothetical protein
LYHSSLRVFESGVGLALEDKNSTPNVINTNTKDIYDISSKVLKISIDFISYPLHIIINSCFEEGYFPEQLKKSKIVPIFKKGNKEEVQNYRPIAIVPALSKIFELAIKIRLTDYFDKQGFFSERQYGYRKSRSTITALLEVANRIIHMKMEAFYRLHF